jgi:hypothetical protein
MKKTILTLASACVLATTAQAGISYNEVIAEYIRPDWDLAGDGDGGAISASYSPVEHFYIAGSAQYADISGADFSQFTLGIGGYFPLIENKLHVAADIGGVWQDVDGWGNDSGLYINPHLRWSPHEKIEVRAGAIYTDLDDEEEWAYYGRVFFQVWESVDFTVSYTGNDDYDTLSAGVRLRF